MIVVMPGPAVGNDVCHVGTLPLVNATNVP